MFPTKSAMGGIELLLRKKTNRKRLRWACYIFSYFLYFHKHPLGSYCTIRELIFLMCQVFSHGKMMCFFSGCSEECGRTQALKIPEKSTQMAITNVIVAFRCDIKIERKTLKWWNKLEAAWSHPFCHPGAEIGLGVLKDVFSILLTLSWAFVFFVTLMCYF